MNYRTLGVIGVRLLAIWMIANAIIFLPQTVQVWGWGYLSTSHSDNPAVAEHWVRFIYTLAIVDRVLIAFLLWVFSSWLSQRLIPARNGSSPEASSAILVRGSIAIAGLVIAVTAVPPLITRAITTPGVVSTAGYPYAAKGWTYLGIQAILVLLGLALIFGARRLRDWIFRFRSSIA